MGKIKKKIEKRNRRRKHVRKTIYGTAAKPRLAVFKSLKHIYVQAIDDDNGTTLVSASTIDKDIREKVKDLNKIESAKKVGELLADRLQKIKIKQVIFDRGGYRYHGRVKALADGAREKGIKF